MRKENYVDCWLEIESMASYAESKNGHMLPSGQRYAPQKVTMWCIVHSAWYSAEYAMLFQLVLWCCPCSCYIGVVHSVSKWCRVVTKLSHVPSGAHPRCCPRSSQEVPSGLHLCHNVAARCVEWCVDLATVAAFIYYVDNRCDRKKWVLLPGWSRDVHKSSYRSQNVSQWLPGGFKEQKRPLMYITNFINKQNSVLRQRS